MSDQYPRALPDCPGWVHLPGLGYVPARTIDCATAHHEKCYIAFSGEPAAREVPFAPHSVLPAIAEAQRLEVKARRLAELEAEAEFDATTKLVASPKPGARTPREVFETARMRDPRGCSPVTVEEKPTAWGPLERLPMLPRRMILWRRGITTIHATDRADAHRVVGAEFAEIPQ